MSVALGTSTPTSINGGGDENLCAAGGEFGQGRVFFFAAHAAVDQTQAKRFEFAVGQLFEGGLDVRGFDVLRFFDERDDDVSLAAVLCSCWRKNSHHLARFVRLWPDRCGHAAGRAGFRRWWTRPDRRKESRR